MIKKEVIVRTFYFCLAVFLVFSSSSSFAEAENNPLAQLFTWTKGDWVAYQLSEDFRVMCDKVRADHNSPAAAAPTFVFYNKLESVVYVEIYGARHVVENAKESISFWYDHIKDTHISEMWENYHIKVDENDYKVIYYNRKTNKKIIKIEKGKYILPED